MEWVEDTGTIPLQYSFPSNSPFEDGKRGVLEEMRKKRNEARRRRYAEKHSKKAKLAKLHADKAVLEATVKKLKKALEEHTARKKKRTK